MAEQEFNLALRVQAALGQGHLQDARSQVFHWLKSYLASLPEHPNRKDLRAPEMWRCLGDVVERTSDHFLLELFWQGMDRVRPAALPPAAPLPLLGVPLLNRPDLLERLLASLDHPVETLAIVDNSRGASSEAAVRELLERLEREGHPGVRQIAVARPFGNAGVASSWNLILRAFPAAPLCLLINNDVVMAPGVLKQALKQLNAGEPQIMPLLPVPQQFSAFVITASCWDRIGLFDPGFYPAYCEDLDYRDRLRDDPSVQWLEPHELQSSMAHLNHIGSATITSDADFASRNRSSFALNRLWWLSHRRLRHDSRGSWLRQWLTEWKD